MSNIIVTGATSMVGVALIEAALEDNSTGKVLAIVRPDSNKMNRLPKDERIEVAEVDMDDYKRLDGREGYDIFYHLAWSRTETYKESYEDMRLKCASVGG